MQLTETTLQNCIQVLSDHFIHIYGLATPRQINQGYCVEFAEELEDMIKQMGFQNYNEIEIVSEGSIKLDESYSFGLEKCDDTDMRNCKWDIQAIEEEFHSEIPKGITVDVLNRNEPGFHLWIQYMGKFYDAECITGVRDLFDLPFYSRFVERIRVS